MSIPDSDNIVLQYAIELHDKLKREGWDEAVFTRLRHAMSYYDGDTAVVPSKSLVGQIEALERESRHYTGIKKLDAILDGFRSNQLVVLSAPPKAGKTQLCVHIARHIKNTTMFLFEESAAEVMYKYHKRGLPLPEFYTTQTTIFKDMDDLYRKMIESWAKYGSTVFFVDHLHYLLDTSKVDTSTKIKNVMQELKEFAKRHNFTIILIAHMTKGGFTEPPGVEAIRDSSFIPQYADTTIILWRETYNSGARGHKNVWNYTNNVLLNVVLNRKINFTTDVNTGLVDLTFDPGTWSYEESDWYTEWIEDGKDAVEKKRAIMDLLET